MSKKINATRLNDKIKKIEKLNKQVQKELDDIKEMTGYYLEQKEVEKRRFDIIREIHQKESVTKEEFRVILSKHGMSNQGGSSLFIKYLQYNPSKTVVKLKPGIAEEYRHKLESD